MERERAREIRTEPCSLALFRSLALSRSQLLTDRVYAYKLIGAKARKILFTFGFSFKCSRSIFYSIQLSYKLPSNICWSHIVCYPWSKVKICVMRAGFMDSFYLFILHYSTCNYLLVLNQLSSQQDSMLSWFKVPKQSRPKDIMKLHFLMHTDLRFTELEINVIIYTRIILLLT